MPNCICAVAIDTAIYALDKLYDYIIPPALSEQVQVGCRVRIPFGRGNRRMEGVVLSVKDVMPAEISRLKPIAQVLDETPILDASQIQLAIWMRERLFCTFYACLRQMLPTGLWLQVRAQYTLGAVEITDETDVVGHQIVACFTEECPLLSAERLLSLTDGASTQNVCDRLVAQGVLVRDESVRSRAQAKTQKSYLLAMDAVEAIERVSHGRSAVQMDVVTLLADGASMTHKELAYMTGASDGVLRTMVKKGLLSSEKVEVLRLPDVGEIEPMTLSALSDAQQQALERLAVQADMQAAQAALLFGVTGSGKTQVYLHLIHKLVAQGKSVIMLLPEIGLTPQFIRLFMGHFGQSVAVLHSALSVGERFDSWNRIREGKAQVVIGTRSAIFAPVQNLGAIIIDEEQDSAYKSEQTPRYHARDIAKYRVARQKALLVLGSATPSVETYYAGMEGKFPIITLPERFAGSQLPQVEIVTRRGDAYHGFGGMIGSVLYAQIKQTLARGDQVILFLNRRGYSRSVTCAKCGWVPTCVGCSAPMTYHAHNGRLMCHYCGASKVYDGFCPDCLFHAIESPSAGTQKVEEELHRLLPDAKVLRMDADSTLGKNAHAQLLDTFGKRHADILIGTQMVAKGLDFADVTLVGVLDADQMLFAQDFRATERTFSLITQVVGRAGRRDRTGHALIQSNHPEHPVLLQAARQDYLSFYNDEIDRRSALRCPPIAEITLLQAVGMNEGNVMESLIDLRRRIAHLLEHEFSDFPCTVLGPTPAAVVKVASKYHYHLLLRCEDTKRRRQLVAGVMVEFLKSKKNAGISLVADQNPDFI